MCYQNRTNTLASDSGVRADLTIWSKACFLLRPGEYAAVAELVDAQR